LLVSSLNSTSITISREKATADVLAQAKEALIGYAVTDSNRPGNLPCPDVDNDGQLTMNVDYSGSNCVSPVGRLPWKTLGLPDLRDSAGERLWYAVSKTFWATQSTAINSDTAGDLTVTGTTPASNVIAIIFSPGNALSGQSRSSTQTATCTTTGSTVAENLCASNYLEGTNSSLNLPAAPNTGYQTAATSTTFNDQMLAITHDALFSTTEKVVGKRAAIMISTHLSTYWGTSLYPFAAPFTNPATAFYTPSSGTNYGLLPITAVWAGTPSYSLSGVGNAAVLCSLNNGTNSLPNARARCDISSVTGTPTITIIGTLNYLGLWRKYDLNNSSEARVKYFGTNVGAATVPGMNASLAYSINSDSSVTVTFTGVIVDINVTRIELRDVVVDSTYDWLTNNKWQQVMHYAVSPGYAPGGGNACNPLPGTPSCLTVNGSSGGNDKKAVVIMTGRSLAGTHPSASTADYMEGENATPADYIYENKTRSSSFNDYVIPIAP